MELELLTQATYYIRDGRLAELISGYGVPSITEILASARRECGLHQSPFLSGVRRPKSIAIIPRAIMLRLPSGTMPALEEPLVVANIKANVACRNRV
jgi:hypothetical protein